ncbi:MAG: SMP-30/gluconolactonase/LRE family protein [Limnobacter sp.]|nr:SMP-30/gluconolactonase/LRE family protein [Limnobacter sp.]
MMNSNSLPWKALDVPACDLGESPRYAHGRWVWLDIHQRKMFVCKNPDLIEAHHLSLDTQVFNLPDEIACILPTANPEAWIGLGRGGVWRTSQTQGHTHLQNPTYDATQHRYNDGRADAKGRIWISSLVDARAPATAELFCLTEGKIQQQVDGLIVGNGLAFTPDGANMFLADTRHKCIWRYEYDLSAGKLGKRHLVHRYTKGNERPDGACMSTDGSYWVAVLEGYRLDRFGSDGQFVESIPLPIAKPTMPCFGGEGLSTLLVTSGKPDGQHPNLEGFEQASVIACKTNFTGMAEAIAVWG